VIPRHHATIKDYSIIIMLLIICNCVLLIIIVYSLRKSLINHDMFTVENGIDNSNDVSGGFDKSSFIRIQGKSMDGYPKRGFFVDCNRECLKTESCVAYTFNKNTAVCDLKSDMPLITQNDNPMNETFIKKKTVLESDMFIPRLNMQPQSGTDLAVQIKVPSPDDCQYQCLSGQNAGVCVAFVYDDSTNTCTVKSSIGSLTPAVNVDTYIRSG